MSQSLAKILVHIIFSTKQRVPLISNTIRPKLYSYITGILENWDCDLIQTGGTKDHIHLLCVLSKNHAPCKILEQVKKNSSKWIKTLGSEFSKFQWQSGYGIFSVSQSNILLTKKYIEDQEKHHKKMTFQEEFKRFLEKYQVSYDERYIWD